VDQSDTKTQQTRPPYRPPLGIPHGREDRRLGVAVSVALHVIIALLLVVPFARHVVAPILQGAGGPGPAGGGGGGRGGTGGAAQALRNEQLRFIQVAPEAPRAAEPVVTPPPVVVPPKPVDTPLPTPPPQPRADSAAAAKPQPPINVAAAPGSGGGSGTDGTTGSGPGSGGGTGTGIGTGRGSGVGPGTGGGTQANYPPLPVEMFLPPMPIPDRLRGFRMIAEFDVDETGRVVSFTFTETRDGGYNRRLRDVLRSIRFRAGSDLNGRPIRMKAQIEYIL
jgi:periplasmic protein TonB